MLSRHIVVVENEALLRDLIARMLEQAGFTVTGAADVAEALRVCDSTDPDAVVIDIDLGLGPNGFDLADVLASQSPDRGIVFLTNLPDPRFVGANPQVVSRAAAYLRKSQLVDSNDLVEALEAVLTERVDLSHRHDLRAERPLARLSQTQLGVLQMVASGMTNATIAQQRGTTVRAVEGMLARVFAALGIDVAGEGNPRMEAARAYFLARGSIDDGSHP
jgi:DNA-binding NarL/FixJ family response regulator